MKTGHIKITGNSVDVKFVSGTVWMTVNEIADFFRINISTVNKHLKGIFKENLLRENEVVSEHRYTCPIYGECIRIYYNLEVITYLSFRTQSFYAKVFREWVLGSLYQSNKSQNRLIDCDLIIREYSQFSLN
ncbi:hypothetical protein [Dysgonomonas sp. 25]|uniref:hypothetical protein n=1 Tax=Dysgonomonas sp. 25 TaxID=2302933 RepID=UPI0013D28F63|nr:hypothetical protein [Dysgonomonas sp. 25]NDV70372.1 hypothetical protein [Dysgonomonas sp. 25]